MAGTKNRRRGRTGSPGPLSQFDEELARQSAEGTSRAYLEAAEETGLHEEARFELHHLKAQAADTLKRAMTNTGQCFRCGNPGMAVDKVATYAAVAVLDRTGLPPTRTVQVEDKRQVIDGEGILKRAVAALISLEPEAIGQIVEALLLERADSRPYIEKAVAGQLLIGAGA